MTTESLAPTVTHMTTATATAALGKCVACAKVYRTASYTGTYAGSCEDCRVGNWTPRIKWTRIRATVSAHECGGDCTSTKGDKCICSCGGKNHGIAWA